MIPVQNNTKNNVRQNPFVNGPNPDPNPNPYHKTDTTTNYNSNPNPNTNPNLTLTLTLTTLTVTLTITLTLTLTLNVTMKKSTFTADVCEQTGLEIVDSGRLNSRPASKCTLCGHVVNDEHATSVA